MEVELYLKIYLIKLTKQIKEIIIKFNKNTIYVTKLLNCYNKISSSLFI